MYMYISTLYVYMCTTNHEWHAGHQSTCHAYLDEHHRLATANIYIRQRSSGLEKRLEYKYYIIVSQYIMYTVRHVHASHSLGPGCSVHVHVL